MGNDSIAYLNLRSASVDNIYDNYDAIKTASAIILDLRSYPYTDIISPLTNMFVPPNSFLPIQHIRILVFQVC